MIKNSDNVAYIINNNDNKIRTIMTITIKTTIIKMKYEKPLMKYEVT